MPIPKNHMKERLSEAYVRTIVARAGARFDPSEAPEYGIDGTVRRVRQLANGKYQETGWQFHVQIKATENIRLEDAFAFYKMDGAAYNKLVSWEGSAFCTLIVFRIPKQQNEWLAVNEEGLLLKNCCYWSILPTSPRIKPNSSKIIKIPRNQIFDPETVQALLQKVEDGRF